MTHVLMLTNVVSPDKLGGLERYVRELSAELVRKGNEVTVISKRTTIDQASEEVGSDGVLISRYDAPSKRDPLFAVRYPVSIYRAVSEALQTTRANLGADQGSIIHGHFPVPSLVPATRRLQYVYTCHAPVYKEILSEHQGSYALPKPVQRAAVAGMRKAERLVIRRATRIVTLSRFVQSEVLALDPKASSKSVLIPGGMDTEWFSPPEVRATPRPTSAPLIFCARRLVARTGVEQLVQAMAQLRKTIPGATLVIAGEGLRRPNVEKEIESLGLGGHVRLLGRVPDAELLEWYRAADIAVTPTQHLEGFGLSTAEALACGTAVLVTPVGANGEVVRGLPSALVADGTSPDAIARGIVRLWTEPGLMHTVRGGARRHVHPRYSWSQVADQYLDVYKSVGKFNA